MRTYQKLASAFPELWKDHLRRHPSFRKELEEAHGWATAPDSPSRHRDDPLELFESLLGLGPTRDLPPETLERYRAKVHEIMRRAARDLKAYRRSLDADLRSHGRGAEK